ncbi:MAG: carbohydrate ABC transporter permease [Planctomycetes bacterium]|nr:carbohydrate ABC transporter permease [Planctomycetota bacterium]
MPVISKIGAKSFKVRFVYGCIFLVLIVGAITIIYPFTLMLGGSVKSEADFERASPFPWFWINDTVLFQKYAESKHDRHLGVLQMTWWRPIDKLKTIPPLTEADRSEYLQDFIEWRNQCQWWALGHAVGWRHYLPSNGRKFRQAMFERFKGDLNAFAREIGFPLKYWCELEPPATGQLTRVPMIRTPLMVAFEDFAKTRPVEERIIGNPDGHYWWYFLVKEYTEDISRFNKEHGTNYSSYQKVFLTRHPPANERQRKDWEKYVREIIFLQYIRLLPEVTDNFRNFLADRYDNDINAYNTSHETAYKSFDEIPMPYTMPSNRIDLLDREAFIADRSACPLEGIEVYGPRQAFEEFVAKRRGVPVEQVAPIPLPLFEADWHDCMAQTSQLRWELTTRNYKHVLEYVLYHGRGIINTVIYCALSVGLALLVNPLAAYALSRYKPPSTYKILLFCMATMAFPGEVTMIPSFLLLKRFPLWPLMGGLVAFIVVLWILSKCLGNWPEVLRMALALGVGIIVGVWAVPAAMGKPHISLLNNFAALVLPGMANGYSIFLLKGFFDSLPRELYEAADLDGAGEWTKFWTLTMALSKPILAVIALWAFIRAYSAFMFALIIIPDQNMWTMMVWIFQLQSRADPPVVYASLVIAAIPTFLVFLFCQGIIMRGIVVPVEK